MAAKMQCWRLLLVMCLLVAAVLCISLIRSFAATGGQDVAFHFFGARYSVRAQGGKLTLMGLPRARSPDARQAQDFIGRLSNDDLIWTVDVWPRYDRLMAASFPQYQPWRELSKFTDAAVTPALLQALEDPRRFAVAHVLLAARYRLVRQRNDPQKGPIIKSEYHGLLADVNVVVPPSKLTEVMTANGKPVYAPATFDIQDKELVRLNTEQRFELCRQWDSRLHRPLASTHHGLLIAIFLVPPAWAVWRWLRRRAAVLHGRCGHCGYDLRGSSQQCPECGTPIVHPRGNKGDIPA